MYVFVRMFFFFFFFFFFIFCNCFRYMHSFSFACLFFCIVIILVYMYAHYCTINVTVTLFKRNKEYIYTVTDFHIAATGKIMCNTQHETMIGPVFCKGESKYKCTKYKKLNLF